MKRQLTITNLKKELAQLERKDLEKIVCDLYKENEFVSQVLDQRFLKESYEKKLLHTYKEKLKKSFFPNGYRTSFTLKDGKAIVSEFGKVCKNEEMVGDLNLYFAQLGIDFTNMYGDMNEAFYLAVCRAYEKAIDIACDNEVIYQKWADRLSEVVEESDGIGWWLHENIVELYYHLPWLEDE